MNDRNRIRRVKISGALLNQVFTAKPKGGALCAGIVSSAPNDMQVVEMLEHQHWCDTWVFLVRSEEFEPVPEGGVVPWFTPEFHVHYVEPMIIQQLVAEAV